MHGILPWCERASYGDAAKIAHVPPAINKLSDLADGVNTATGGGGSADDYEAGIDPFPLLEAVDATSCLPPATGG